MGISIRKNCKFVFGFKICNFNNNNNKNTKYIYISPNVLISGRTGVKPENFYLRFFFGGGNF